MCDTATPDLRKRKKNWLNEQRTLCRPRTTAIIVSQLLQRLRSLRYRYHYYHTEAQVSPASRVCLLCCTIVAISIILSGHLHIRDICWRCSDGCNNEVASTSSFSLDMMPTADCDYECPPNKVFLSRLCVWGIPIAYLLGHRRASNHDAVRQILIVKCSGGEKVVFGIWYACAATLILDFGFRI